MKKISILLLLTSVLLYACSKKDNDNIQTIKIGGLYSISGNWSSLGKTSSQAMTIALEKVNEYLEERGSMYRFSTIMYDTQLDTASAKSAVQRGFERDNVRIFIGPQSSAELKAIKNYALANNLLIISQSSTASELAIPNDGIFRLCPGDAVEGSAMANTIYQSGKRAIVTIARNDPGNVGLQQAVNTSFSSLGGQVETLNPYPTTQTDFSNTLQAIKTKVQTLSGPFNNHQIGVYLASFDECKDLFRQAVNDPVLSSVNWYGGDGIVQSTVLLSDSVACRFAKNTGFFAPNFGLPSQPHPDLASIKSSIMTATGIEPDAYALSVYDAMWIIARTISSYPNVLNNFSQLKTDFMAEANQYYGITGPVSLNMNGDRQYSNFDLWGIVYENGVYKWALTGNYP